MIRKARRDGERTGILLERMVKTNKRVLLYIYMYLFEFGVVQLFLALALNLLIDMAAQPLGRKTRSKTNNANSDIRINTFRSRFWRLERQYLCLTLKFLFRYWMKLKLVCHGFHALLQKVLNLNLKWMVFSVRFLILFSIGINEQMIY